MTVYHIPLHVIQPNPWQTRSAEDAEYIQELAESIKASGLLQIPLGRLIAAQGEVVSITQADTGWLDAKNLNAWLEAGATVQLACGHNRLAAFRQLEAEHENGYGVMPVNLKTYTDQDMAEIAWIENEKRRDVSAVDKAKAIQARMQQFGWSQTEAAQHLQMARSTLANLLRLLGLPAEVQTALVEKQITERQAAALIPAFELPKEALERASNAYYTPKRLLENAKAGASSDVLRDNVNSLMGFATLNLAGCEFLEHEFAGDAYKSPTCSACPHRVTRGKDQCCPYPSCWRAKDATWRERAVSDLVEELGIRVMPNGLEWSEYTHFYSEHQDRLVTEVLDQPRAARCPNLRIEYDDRVHHESPLGNEHARLVCFHGKGHKCTCLADLKKRMQAEERARNRDNRSAMETEIIDPAVRAVLAAIDADNLGVWQSIAGQVDYGAGQRAAQLTSAQQIRLLIAQRLVRAGLPWGDHPEADLAECRKGINERLTKMGLPTLEEMAGNNENQVQEIKRRLARVQGWMDSLAKNLPAVEAMQGNFANLTKIIDSPDAAPEDVDTARDLRDRIEAVLGVMVAWRPDPEEFKYVHRLTNGSPSGNDVTYKIDLEEASENALRYALELIRGVPNNATRVDAIQRQLRRRISQQAAQAWQSESEEK